MKSQTAESFHSARIWEVKESQEKTASRLVLLSNLDKMEKVPLNQETIPLMKMILLLKPHSQTALVNRVKLKVLIAKNQKLKKYAQETNYQLFKKVKQLTASSSHFALRTQECQLVNAGPQDLPFSNLDKMPAVILNHQPLNQMPESILLHYQHAPVLRVKLPELIAKRPSN